MLLKTFCASQASHFSENNQKLMPKYAEELLISAAAQLEVPRKVPPLPMQNVLYTVTENVTAALPNKAAPSHVGGPGWAAAQFPGGCSTTISSTNFTSGEFTSLATIQITGNSTLYTGDADFMDNLELSEVPAWYLPSAITPATTSNW